MGGAWRGRTGGATTMRGGSSATTTGSSRKGRPHLWQNRASSGSRAPQVQYSGTTSVCHVILKTAMSVPTLLVIADPAADYLKPLTGLAGKATVRIGNDPEFLAANAPAAVAILYADTRPQLLASALP